MVMIPLPLDGVFPAKAGERGVSDTAAPIDSAATSHRLRQGEATGARMPLSEGLARGVGEDVGSMAVHSEAGAPW